MAKDSHLLYNFHEEKKKRNLLKYENIETTLELHELQRIVSNLRTNYEDSKGVCPVYRYSMLKDMIKEAIKAARKDNLVKPKGLVETVNLKHLRIKEETKRGLKRMHKAEIEASTETKRQQIMKIRSLEINYEISKRLCFLYRYGEMKRMIISTIQSVEKTRDYTTDDERHPLLASEKLGHA